MANKTKTQLKDSLANRSLNPLFRDLVDSAQLTNPGVNHLPTSDPSEAGALFVTGSTGMNLGNITGSGFAVLCVSQG